MSARPAPAAAVDPLGAMRAAREAARAGGDPLVDVCFLATVGRGGTAEVRPLTLRDIGERGLGLLISRTSRKWSEIEETDGACSLLVYWQTVARQYRVRGRVAPMERSDVERFWGRKSHGSRLLEHFYSQCRAQSAPLAARGELEDGIARLRARWPDARRVPIPPSLAGVEVVPETVEIWHGSPGDRLHDRRLCERRDGGWSSTLLVP